MKSKILALLIAFLTLAWIGSGFVGDAPVNGTADSKKATLEKKADTASAPKALVQVRVRALEPEIFTDHIAVTGRTQASRSVIIRAETAGQIHSVNKQEGDAVEESSILAQLELRDRSALVREAKGRVAQRRIEYNAAKKLADKGFNSKVRLAQAEADLENAKALLKTAQTDLSHIRIAAPFSGTLSEQNVEVGDVLSIGDPLFTLMDLDPIELSGFVSERHVQHLTLGMEARATFLDGRSLTGKISYIAPAADPQTRTFRIQISAPNAEGTVKEGMTAKIAIPLAPRYAHKISPAILTLNDAGEIGLKFVDDNDIVRFAPVDILADKAEAMWVGGLPETGKVRVITVGQDYVRGGQKVKPVLKDGEGLL